MMNEDIMNYGEHCIERIHMSELSAYEDLSLLGIDFIAWAEFEDHYLLKRTGREDEHFNVIFPLAGEMELEFPGQKFTLTKGDCAFLPSWYPRSLKLVAGESYREIYFKLNMSDKNRVKSFKNLVFKSSCALLMEQLFKILYEERAQNRPRKHQVLSSTASLMASYFYRECCKLEDQFTETTAENLKSFWKEIGAQLGESWTMDSLAMSYGVSRSGFYRLMKDYYSMSPLAYLRSLRIKKAKDLLVNSSWSLEELATALSYSSAYNFSEAFYKETGQRPGQFRKERSS